MRKINEYIILVPKAAWMRLLDRPNRTWKDNIKMDAKNWI
jgi:hypothetical protein